LGEIGKTDSRVGCIVIANLMITDDVISLYSQRFPL